MYKLQAHTTEYGVKIDQSTPEFLGISNEYASKDEAISAALDFEADIEEMGLPQNTFYTVHDADGNQVWSTED